MAIKILNKSVDVENYRASFTSGNTERTERILVKRIPLSTYFGDSPGEFYKKYSKRGVVTITPKIEIKNENMDVEQIEYLYEESGEALSSREPRYNDVILVYVTIKIPVKIGTIETAAGYYHMDFNPTIGHKHSIAHNGYDRFVPSYISESEITKSEVDNKELLARPMNIYLRPTRIRDKGNNNAIIRGTERNTVLYHTDQDFWFDIQDVQYDPSMLRLAKVIVHANSNISDNMTILDTRTRGGGLDEALTRKVIKSVNEESLFNWDIGYFDGEAYQENGIIIIKLPTTLRERFGENYQAIVQEAIVKHKAFGTLPIVEFYNPEDVNTGRFALLPNHNFSDGNHISYYDPELSNYNQVEATPEGYLINVPSGKQYGFKIPSYRLDEAESIRIRPHTKRLESTQRIIGRATIHYEHDTLGYSKKDVNLNVEDLYDLGWKEFDYIINLYEGIDEDELRYTKITHIDVILVGPMKIDSVSVRAYDNYNYADMEVIEL